MKLARFQRPDLWNWSAFDHLTNIRDEIDRLFESPVENGSSDVFNTCAPALDVYEDSNSITVRAEVPGMKKEDLDISLHENVITISGERKNEKTYEGRKTSREERSLGRFTRSIHLPKPVDASKVKASYRDGVLTVVLPKAEGARPRQINVQD